MPQIDFDGANSAVKTDKIQGQSGTTVTVTSGHNLAGSGSGLTALPAANLTGTLPAISGANLTGITNSGMWQFISKQTASASSTVDFFGLATGTYNKFRIEFYDVYPSADAVMQIRLREVGASTILTQYYNGATIGGYANTTDNTVASNFIVDPTTEFDITETSVNGGSGATRMHGYIEMSGFGTTSTRPAYWGIVVGADSSTTSGGNMFWGQQNGADSDGYDGIRFLLSTGNYTAGSFSLYGLKES